MEFKRTRIAPTPSGFLHLGNIYSFAVTAALARRTGAAILLRIDDLDRDRVQREYVQDIFDTLRFMEIPWDEGPADISEFEREWSQVHRLPLYERALERLRISSSRTAFDPGAGTPPVPAVFGCVCSRAQVLRESRDGGYPGTCETLGIPPDMPEVTWRLRTSAVMGSGVMTLPAEMRDFVVRKKDGFPAYQLSSLVDDLHYGVDLIVRGQDLWASTLAQYYLSYFLDGERFRAAHFYHHSLLTADGGKLSKSAGATSIRYLREQGLTRGEIYALIARSLESGNAAAAGSGAGAAARQSAHSTPVSNWAELAALVEIRASRLQG